MIEPEDRIELDKIMSENLILLSDNPNEDQARYRLAKAAANLNLLSQAKAEYEYLVAKNTEIYHSYKWLASIEYGDKRYERVLELMKVYEAHEDLDSYANFLIGMSCWGLGDIEGAIKYLESEYVQEPHNNFLKRNLVTLHEKAGNQHRADHIRENIAGDASSTSDIVVPLPKQVNHFKTKLWSMLNLKAK